MIKAKFIKATPTEDGITYVLKGPKDKVALHGAVDLQDLECTILENKGIALTPTIESMDNIVSNIMLLAQKLQGYVRKDEPVKEDVNE